MTSTTTPAIEGANAAQAAAWDGPEGDLWAAHAALFDRSVAGYDAEFLAAAAIGRGDDVLDIGCGTGFTTREAGRRAPEGSALGVDLSGAMVRVARAAAASEGLAHVRFVQADAQVHPFEPAAFDVVISRTGAMFFADPTAAFANIARALRPRGRMVLLVWQGMDRNEWIGEFLGAMSSGRQLPVPPPDAPGPFALGDPRRVGRLLTGAGFEPPSIVGVERPMDFGTPDEAYGLISQLLGWMLQGLDDAGRDSALTALRRSVEAHVVDGVVRYGSAAWLVSSRVG